MLRFEKRDIASGKFNYGERIRLAQIFSDEKLSDCQVVMQVIECLHGKDISPKESAQLLDYVKKVRDDFSAWIEREKQELYIPPTPEETRAGIEELSKKCGEMGMVVTLAKEFHYSFEQVYQMPYLDVFTIQKIDTERAKYERRLSKVYTEKSKIKK